MGQSIEISSGNVYCNSVDNDGIDSNGSIIISGGIVASINQTKPNESLDAENGKLFFRGGIVFGIGSAAVTGISSSCPYYNTRYDLHSENMPKRGLLLNYGKYVCVQKGNEILMALRNYNKEHRQFVTIIHPLFELSGF